MRLFPTSCLLGALALPLGAATAVAQNSDASRTRYPIVLSHHWSGTASTSFRGDTWDGSDFNAYGIKTALEREGATVYQPDKIPFADHLVRGQLLYKRCALSKPLPAKPTLAQQKTAMDDALCLNGTPRVDGVEKAMADFCASPVTRGTAYASEADCIQNIKVNIICHSQGCPDSRYMVSALTNRLSGKPMADHVASWTSLAGANKGTALADTALSAVGCMGSCDNSLVASVLNQLGLDVVQNQGSSLFYAPYVLQSVRALTRKYMTQTMDTGCDPVWQKCAPSFNEKYPNSPKVFYQSYSFKIDRLDPCDKAYDLRWAALFLLEGSNDGLISVESQRFTTTGYGAASGANKPTGVLDRGLTMGTSTGSKSYPGMAHMAMSTHPAAGLPGPACAQATASNPDMGDYHFSREALYKQIVAGLKSRGF
ncbi:MAG: hypothetical protein RL385_143 [Pseudomonadota bacterium]